LLALRRWAALDARDDRPDRGPPAVRRPRLHPDPGCPWAYAASPAIATLRWRHGEQLRWTLVTIGLAENPALYARRGCTPLRSAIGYTTFRRCRMPFQVASKERLSATSSACRAVVATRLAAPHLEDAAFRALQFAQFTTTGLLDDPETLRCALSGVEGLDADPIVAAIETPVVRAAYEADRARARTAAGSPTEFQDRAANTDGTVRYTAPSLIFETDDGRRLEAGGFQPVACTPPCDPRLRRGTFKDIGSAEGHAWWAAGGRSRRLPPPPRGHRAGRRLRRLSVGRAVQRPV